MSDLTILSIGCYQRIKIKFKLKIFKLDLKHKSIYCIEKQYYAIISIEFFNKRM